MNKKKSCGSMKIGVEKNIKQKAEQREQDKTMFSLFIP